jgi:GntR family transcriptional regulator
VATDDPGGVIQGLASPVLAYVQLANDLARRIETAELPGRLPSERDLASEYAVAYGTVRRLRECSGSVELVESVHGRGTFIKRVT